MMQSKKEHILSVKSHRFLSYLCLVVFGITVVQYHLTSNAFTIASCMRHGKQLTSSQVRTATFHSIYHEQLILRYCGCVA